MSEELDFKVLINAIFLNALTVDEKKDQFLFFVLYAFIL